MDIDSPENTVIAKSLRDLNRFIKCGNRSSGPNSTPWSRHNNNPRMQLNFSEADEEEENDNSESIQSSGVKRKITHDSSVDYVKKHRNSVTGLDVCKLLREKDSELVDARALITSLKGQISSANSTNTQLKCDYDKELSELRLNELHNKELISELQLKLKQGRESSERLKEENRRVRTESAQLKCTLEQRLTSNTTQASTLTEQLKQNLSLLEEKLANTENKLKGTVAELDISEKEVKNLRDDIAKRIKQAQELHTELLQVTELKLQLNKANFTIKELEGRLANVASQEHLLEKFEESVRKLPELEREVAKLKEANDMYKAIGANTRLLEEQVASASDEIALLKQRNSDSAQIQADLDFTKEQLKSFSGVVCEELSLDTVPQSEELRTLLRSLRSNDKSITDSITAMKESVLSHEQQCISLQKEAEQLKETNEQQVQLSVRRVQLARRLQRKLLLVTKERDALKAILTSYEAEATMTAATVSSSNRTAVLEETLTQYKQEIARLEEELDQYQQAPKLPGDEEHVSREDRKELTTLQEKVNELQESVSKLQEEKDVLEYRLEQRALKGDYDPSQVNVVHMTQNPTSEAIAHYKCEVTRLEEEIKHLKEQVTKLQQGINVSTIEPPPSVSTEEDKKKIQELEKEVKSMEVKNMRLVEAFKKSGKELREVVYRVLGYKILPVGADGNCYKLSSMYAESPDDYFMFELSSDGDLHLLSTDFSSSLEELIEDYLNRDSSYPAFLSAVTMDLFRKQTMVVQHRVEGAAMSSPTRGQSHTEQSTTGSSEGGAQQREEQRYEAQGEEQDEYMEEEESDEEEYGMRGDEEDDEEMEERGRASNSEEDEEREEGAMDDSDSGGAEDEEEEEEEEDMDDEYDEEERDDAHYRGNNAPVIQQQQQDDDDDDDLICLD